MHSKECLWFSVDFLLLTLTLMQWRLLGLPGKKFLPLSQSWIGKRANPSLWQKYCTWVNLGVCTFVCVLMSLPNSSKNQTSCSALCVNTVWASCLPLFQDLRTTTMWGLSPIPTLTLSSSVSTSAALKHLTAYWKRFVPLYWHNHSWSIDRAFDKLNRSLLALEL